MKCHELQEHWEDWRAGHAPAAVERHLRACARCRDQAAQLAETSEWISLLRLEAAQPSPGFWVRLRERLEETESRAAFWLQLARAASRAALALAVFVILFAVWVLRAPPKPAVAEFSSPPAQMENAAAVTAGYGQLDRDQVVLTLVSYQEAAR